MNHIHFRAGQLVRLLLLVASLCGAGCITTHHITPPVHPGAQGTALPQEDVSVAVSGLVNAGLGSGYAAADGELSVPISDRMTVDGALALSGNPLSRWSLAGTGRAGFRYKLTPKVAATQWVVGAGGTIGRTTGEPPSPKLGDDLLWGPWASVGVAGTRPDVRPFADLGVQLAVWDYQPALWTTVRTGVAFGGGAVTGRVWAGPTVYVGRLKAEWCLLPQETFCGVSDKVRVSPGITGGVTMQFDGSAMRSNGR